MAVDAQGRSHEPKGIPTGGQYARGSTGHGMVDDLPDLPAGMDDDDVRVEDACNDWLGHGRPEDGFSYRMEDGSIRNGRYLREMFAGQVEEQPDAYCDDPSELDHARLDDEYRVWLHEHERDDMIAPADARLLGLGDYAAQAALRRALGALADDMRGVDFDLPDGTTLCAWAADGQRVDRGRLPAGWHVYSVTEDETDERDPAWGGDLEDAPYRTVLSIRGNALVNHRMDIVTTRGLDLEDSDVFVDGDKWGFGDDTLGSGPYPVSGVTQEQADDALLQLESDDDARAADRMMADHGLGRDAFANACIRSAGLDDLPGGTVDLMRETADANALLAEHADDASPAHAYRNTFRAFADFRGMLGRPADA